jgi:transcriptional regulator with XRE-family HTH domain
LRKWQLLTEQANDKLLSQYRQEVFPGKMIEEIAIYNQDVMAGRPATKAAPLFGQRLSALRKTKGLTQRELAEALGTTREMVDYYERRAINPALEVVRGCAKALNVSVIELLGSEDKNGKKRRGTGPNGKMRRLFEAASQLPRSQQDKLTAVLEAFVNQHAAR